MRVARVAIAAAVAGLVAAPSAALAAPPGVATGGAAQVTRTSATLTGQVNPGGRSTTYYFQWGATARYGTRTPSTGAGAGAVARTAAAQITGLTPNTRYHYRLVATNAAGTRAGGDRSFVTPRQPLALSLAASINPLRYGAGTSLLGNLSGTGNSGRQVVLQQRPFPYTGPWTNVGNSLITDRAGNFGFTLLTVGQTTQFRVLAPVSGGNIVSPILTVTVTVAIQTDVTRTTVRRGSKIRFFGAVRPAVGTLPFGVQKRGRSGRWVTVAGGVTHTSANATFSRYGKTFRLRRGGTYRVYVGAAGGPLAPTFGREVKIRSYR